MTEISGISNLISFLSNNPDVLRQPEAPLEESPSLKRSRGHTEEYEAQSPLKRNKYEVQYDPEICCPDDMQTLSNRLRSLEKCLAKLLPQMNHIKNQNKKFLKDINDAKHENRQLSLEVGELTHRLNSMESSPKKNKSILSNAKIFIQHWKAELECNNAGREEDMVHFLQDAYDNKKIGSQFVHIMNIIYKSPHSNRILKDVRKIARIK